MLMRSQYQEKRLFMPALCPCSLAHSPFQRSSRLTAKMSSRSLNLPLKSMP